MTASLFFQAAIPALFMVCFGLLAYALLESLREGAENYSRVYARETARKYEDVFLFIPPRRLADIARLSAVAAALIVFLLLGDLGSTAGVVRGVVLGGLSGTAMLFAPGALLHILQRRRRDRFTRQLVDALISMSGALRAGFSILQSYETIVKQRQNPIAQEFGIFLQQVRVGVRFEDALRNMEHRMPSEDLVLMNQSIEIARLTGGNLTEVFESIAGTIRERLRIEQRIRSLTAQGRLQGLVVGAVPAVLLLALTIIDPGMMMPFFASRTGLGLLALAAGLEVAGAWLIRRIVTIQV